MRKIIFSLWTAVVLCSCFNTRFDDTEEKLQQRIRDSIRTDSIEHRRSIADTTLAIYKRTAFCDTVYVIVFDRVKRLHGEEAADYAQRHKRYGNTGNIIVNKEGKLETLKIAPGAPLLLIDDGRPKDSSKVFIEVDGKDTIRYVQRQPSFLPDEMPKEELVKLVIQHRSIIYFKQLPKLE